jgi:hypothetical protein
MKKKKPTISSGVCKTPVTGKARGVDRGSGGSGGGSGARSLLDRAFKRQSHVSRSAAVTDCASGGSAGGSGVRVPGKHQ